MTEIMNKKDELQSPWVRPRMLFWKFIMDFCSDRS